MNHWLDCGQDTFVNAGCDCIRCDRVGMDTGAMGTVATVAGLIRYFPAVILPGHPRGSSGRLRQSLF